MSNEVAKKATAEVAAVDYEALGLSVDSNLEGVEASTGLPEIEVVHAAGLFKMPDATTCQKFEAVILDTHRTNSYWGPEQETGSMPKCFSKDGITPTEQSEEKQSEKCADCTMNTFGTQVKDDGSIGRGKACLNSRQLYLMMPGNKLPFKLQASPTSIKAIEKYLILLANDKKPYIGVVTQFALKSATNKASGQQYQQLELSRGDLLPKEAILELVEYKQKNIAMMRGVAK